MKMLLRSLALIGLCSAAVLATDAMTIGHVQQHVHAASIVPHTLHLQVAAFVLSGLRRAAHGGVLATGSPAGLWHYMTNDDGATVIAANYFNGAAAYLGKGDVIIGSLDIDGTPTLKNFIVTSNDGSTVAVALQTTT